MSQKVVTHTQQFDNESHQSQHWQHKSGQRLQCLCASKCSHITEQMVTTNKKQKHLIWVYKSVCGCLWVGIFFKKKNPIPFELCLEVETNFGVCSFENRLILDDKWIVMTSIDVEQPTTSQWIATYLHPWAPFDHHAPPVNYWCSEWWWHWCRRPPPADTPNNSHHPYANDSRLVRISGAPYRRVVFPALSDW